MAGPGQASRRRAAGTRGLFVEQRLDLLGGAVHGGLRVLVAEQDALDAVEIGLGDLHPVLVRRHRPAVRQHLLEDRRGSGRRSAAATSPRCAPGRCRSARPWLSDWASHFTRVFASSGLLASVGMTKLQPPRIAAVSLPSGCGIVITPMSMAGFSLRIEATSNWPDWYIDTASAMKSRRLAVPSFSSVEAGDRPFLKKSV